VGDKITVEVNDFKRYEAKQKTPVWCWAACIQMVINQHEIELSQDDVVRNVKGKIAFDTASAEEIKDFLNGWKSFESPQKRWATNCDYKAGAPDPNRMFRQLGISQRPLIVSLKTEEDEDVEHVVALFKTEYIVGDDIELVTVYDPYTGQEEDLEWEDAKDRITGTWYPTVISSGDRIFSNPWSF
jgi:ABC-type bacteriocin/lantibiotic exporter with double-glycine peptidase domain